MKGIFLMKKPEMERSLMPSLVDSLASEMSSSDSFAVACFFRVLGIDGL
jgi:hypothetical protein